MICWRMKSDKHLNYLLSGQREEKQKKAAFLILLIIMAIYYGYRLFALTPWYDELYTYYCFISKGPLYAAIHWPLPNNHVGYSVLSAFLDFFGNSYIGLRGVSYLCALANIILLYKAMGKYLKGWLPLCTVVLYISMNLVNQMAVQGRGYTLGITCYLTAWLCMISICEKEKTGKKVYITYIAALVLGLYAVSSNVYWVAPLCMAGGLFLLAVGIREGKRDNCFFLKTQSGRKLIKLVAASLTAALGTVALYAVIWMSIGSNLLVKDVSSIYYGMGHVKMILKAPFAAINRGMTYMLDTPYIQSEERAGFAGRLKDWIVDLSGYYFGSLEMVVVIILLMGIVFLVCQIIRSCRQKQQENMLLYLFLLTGIMLVPVILLIQCKRPYYRVFTYGGVLLAALLGVLADGLLKGISRISDGQFSKRVMTALALLTIAFGVKCLWFSGYNVQYGTREHEIADAFEHGNMEKWENYCVTDCNQEYLLYFLYGIRCENREIEGADVVLLDKRMTDPGFNEMVWEFYHYYDMIPWDYIEGNMTKTYENENYVLYTINS